jgi:hypothetical protein
MLALKLATQKLKFIFLVLDLCYKEINLSERSYVLMVLKIKKAPF